MFCSFLQERLGWGGAGRWLFGAPQHKKLGLEARERVDEKVRQIWHMPEPRTVSSIPPLRLLIISDIKLSILLGTQIISLLRYLLESKELPSKAMNTATSALVCSC